MVFKWGGVKNGLTIGVVFIGNGLTGGLSSKIVLQEGWFHKKCVTRGVLSLQKLSCKRGGLIKMVLQ